MSNSSSSNKIDLKDLSFVFIARIDSDDRMGNLQIIHHYITSNFDTNIIILECDKQRRLKKFDKYSNTTYIFIQDSNELLHRTKYINYAVNNLVKTKYLSIYDIDVILPVFQITKSYSLLCNNFSDLVLPYDGRFVDIILKDKIQYITRADLSFNDLQFRELHIKTRRSVGGAIFLSTSTYIESGMENEFFTSWGVEDTERLKRFFILGKKIDRVSGKLYHLVHTRGINSRFCTEALQLTFFSEYLKICSYTKSQLELYINTWPWKNQ